MVAKKFAVRELFRRLIRGRRSRLVVRVIKARQSAKHVALILRNAIVRKIVLPAIYSPRLSKLSAVGTNRKKPFFLLLRHKYYHGQKRMGITSDEHHLSGPLRSAQIADTMDYYYDIDGSGGLLGDSKLVNLITQVRPDLVFMFSYNPLDGRHPNIDVLRAIRSKYQIPFVALWPDSHRETIIDLVSDLSEVVDLHLEWDSGALCRHFPGRADFLRLWEPLDFSIFYPGDGYRDIPVSFVGATLGYHENVRQAHLDYLKEQQIDVYRAGGVREQLVSLEDYALLFRRSKISLSFSHYGNGKHQLKGRVFEVTFSGALLVENENDETSQFFTPMVDYVDFHSKGDLADKLRYYLQHDEEREEIAYNGYMKAITEYNHHMFWKKVMDRLVCLKIDFNRE